MKFYNFRRKILNDGMNEEARVATFHLSHNPRFSFFVGYIGTPRRKRYTDCLDFRSASPSTNASVESEARNRQRKAKVHIVIEIINSVHHMVSVWRNGTSDILEHDSTDSISQKAWAIVRRI